MEACKRISDRVVVYLDKKKRKDKINGYAYCPLKYGISPLKKKKRISQFFFLNNPRSFPFWANCIAMATNGASCGLKICIDKYLLC